MTLPQFLKEFREKHGLTQEQMAKKVKCSLDHYKHIETGYFKPGVNLRYNIAQATRKSPKFIYNLINKEGE